MSQKSVVAYKDGKFQYFNSITSCAKSVELDVHTVINLVNHRKTSAGVSRKSLGGYQIVLEKEINLIDKAFVPEVHAKPVGGRIRGTNGEETREFDSQNQAERELHISRPSIRHSLQTGKATKGWNFEFIKGGEQYDQQEEI